MRVDKLNGNGLYIDLINELKNTGNHVYIVTPNEKKYNTDTFCIRMGLIDILKVRTGNLTQTNFIQKGISTVLIEYQFIKAIKKYYGSVKFDMILYATPPVTFEKVVSYVKNRDNCMSYLILKDIFPQNAVDLGIIQRDSLVYRYFRSKEKNLYAVSDFIGCTSKGNIEFVKKHNCNLDPSKIELFPNSIKPRKLEDRNYRVNSLRKKYGIPKDAIVFIYGGNIGKPQGIDYIKEVLKRANMHKKLFFMILGSGTDFLKLSQFISDLNYENVRITRSIPQDEYWEFLSCCDVGLIFLDKRFTVPNTPARLTYYMESALPILAATDKNTDVNKILIESHSGYWVESGDIEEYYKYVDTLANDEALRTELGTNGRHYLEENYTIDKNYQTLIKHIKER